MNTEVEKISHAIQQMLREEIQKAVETEREACAMLHESINAACDHERQGGHPGAGAMAAVIEYRDAIRSRKEMGR